MKLLRKSTQQPLVPQLVVADSTWTRMKGLLGRKHLPNSEGLWILHCNSIHTFFMKFPIDLIFLSRKMVVTKVVSNVRPGRLIWPVLSASSVVELSEGFIKQHNVQIGEEFYVDRSLS